METPRFEPPRPISAVELKLESLFEEWVAQGEGRSYGVLARRAQLSPTLVVAHARKFLWPQRLAAIMSMASQRTAERLAESLAEVNERHIAVAKKAQAKAWAFLENAVFDKPADAIRLLVEATRIEREARGMGEKDASLTEVLTERIRQIQATEVGAKQLPAPEKEFSSDPVEFETFDGDPVQQA